jgi:hypothetical protein
MRVKSLVFAFIHMCFLSRLDLTFSGFLPCGATLFSDATSATLPFGDVPSTTLPFHASDSKSAAPLCVTLMSIMIFVRT